jgi:hypothetical protein
MIITFFRSSSFNEHTLCPHAYFLRYTLGIPARSNIAAAKGTIVHKALEMLAWVGICRRQEQGTYHDDTFGEVVVDDATPEWVIAKAYTHYSAKEPYFNWSDKDLYDCQDWMNMALTFNKGMYDPRNLDVICPEQRFDFEIAAPWAAYKYETPDGVLEGQLRLKGTMDLVVRDKHDPSIIEIVDWKTGGSRKDFAKDTDKEKTYADFMVDPQLNLYHYAARNLFPTVDDIHITIFYIRAGGPFRLCFGREDMKYTEKILEAKFNEIKETTRPKLVKTWRCYRTCHYGKTRSEQNPNKTICQFVEDEVRRKGIDQTTVNLGNPNAFMRYGEGGGASERE